MNPLWLAVAFLAGVLFWHYVGIGMVKRAFGKEWWRGQVLGDVSTSTLARLGEAVEEEKRKRLETLSQKEAA